MYDVNQLVQIINHSEPSCNGQYGTVTAITVGYNGQSVFYTVLLEDADVECTCTDDELMEG